MIISLPKPFSTELTLSVLDSFLDEAFFVEDFFLEEIDAHESDSNSEQYEEIIPKHQNLKILQEFHKCLQEAFRDDFQNTFAYLPKYRYEDNNE